MLKFIDLFTYLLGALAILQSLHSVRFHLPVAQAAALKQAVHAAHTAFYIAAEAGLPNASIYHRRLHG
jgi:hypothetical protein